MTSAGLIYRQDIVYRAEFMQVWTTLHITELCTKCTTPKLDFQSNNLAICTTFVQITYVSTKHFPHKYQKLVEINVVMNSFDICKQIHTFITRYFSFICARYISLNKYIFYITISILMPLYVALSQMIDVDWKINKTISLKSQELYNFELCYFINYLS